MQGKVANLEGLSHTQVTGYDTMQDPRLQIILGSILEMQQAATALGNPQQTPPGSGGLPTQGPPILSGNPLPTSGGLPQGFGGAGRVPGAATMPNPARLNQVKASIQ